MSAENRSDRRPGGIPSASSNALAAASTLAAGDGVVFNSSVPYRGSFAIPRDGSSGSPITYKGSGWGSASAPIVGWSALAYSNATVTIGGTYAAGDTVTVPTTTSTYTYTDPLGVGQTTTTAGVSYTYMVATGDTAAIIAAKGMQPG